MTTSFATENEDKEVIDSGSDSGWATTTTCKRHSYKGGDRCVRCDTPRPLRVVTPRNTSNESSSSRETSAPVKHLRLGLSMTWMAMGYGLTKVPERVPQLKPLEVSGRMMMFESAVAGTRLQQALKKTPAWRPIMAMMRHVSPWSELIPLLAPPVLVGLMAWQPSIRSTLMGPLMGALLPLMEETSKMATEQAEMIQAMNVYSEDNQEAAMQFLDQLFDNGESESN